jgi:hypothetical protein
MTRLNQVLAVEGGAKSRAARTLTDAHHTLARPVLLEGIARDYRPVDENGERFPSESKKVQLRVPDVLTQVREALAKLFDVVATKETANRHASADVVVDGGMLLENVPVTYLLFLEKQLVDIHTFIAKLPTLDPTKEWSFDEAVGVYATPVVDTVKTKKIPRNHTLAPATDKHPAQVEVYHEDVVTGYWSTRIFSGALPQTRVDVLLNRVVALQEAVKRAREEANTGTVEEVHFAKPVFDYLLA